MMRLAYADNVVPSETAEVARPVPLVVDLDKALLKADIFLESIFLLLSSRPIAIFKLPILLAKGRDQVRSLMAKEVTLEIETLPMNEAMLEYIRVARAEGRSIFLASALSPHYVERVARHLGLFDGIVISDCAKDHKRISSLCQKFGEQGFDYVTGDYTDPSAWENARHVIAVNCSPVPPSSSHVRQPEQRILSRSTLTLRQYIAAMRVHQWSKNSLLFLPALAAHSLSPADMALLFVAFAAFSLVASSIYILNDLLDLTADRQHPAKRFRPFASGALPLSHGLLLSAGLFPLGLFFASLVSTGFLFIVLLYCVATILYSVHFKRKAVLDVFALAGLYTLRVFAGAVAVAVPISPWMLAFSVFFFLCLASVKRFTELKARLDAGSGAPLGRGYLLSDTPMIMIQAGAAGYASVVILALYVNSPKVIELYSTPEGLWLACGLLLYWLTRLLLLAHRGDMHHDPIVFALKDRVSLLIIALTGLAVVGSAAL